LGIYDWERDNRIQSSLKKPALEMGEDILLSRKAENLKKRRIVCSTMR
jgi:hypothetical protein